MLLPSGTLTVSYAFHDAWQLIFVAGCSVMLPFLMLSVCGLRESKNVWLYIHACIDGGSNFAPYAIVALDKSASTLCNAYHEATIAFEHPLRPRADMCFEAVRIRQDMIDVRPGAYLTGPSTANQVSVHVAACLHRVELCTIAFRAQYNLIHFCTALRDSGTMRAMWRPTSYFKGLVQYMERCGVLNRTW